MASTSRNQDHPQISANTVTV